MFRRFFDPILALIPACWRVGHEWNLEPLVYALLTGSYSVDRVCTRCGRHERRKYLRGRRSGDAAEIIPDPFTGWELVRSK